MTMVLYEIRRARRIALPDVRAGRISADELQRALFACWEAARTPEASQLRMSALGCAHRRSADLSRS